MISDIINASKADAHLAALLEEAGEYAQIYLLAKQRHKGCDGTGELTTLKEEFRNVVDTMVRYSKEHDHLSGNCDYDADSFAFVRMIRM